jgi:hypothetical protein
MMTVAVITAFNPANAGMYSVDLAAVQLLTRIGVRPRLMRLHVNRRKLPYFVGGLRLRRLRDAGRLARHDRILYWGDFLNSPLYGTGDFRHYETYVGRSDAPEAALENWKRFCLLKGVDQSDGHRALSVSQNMQSASHVLAGLPKAEREEIAALYSLNFDAIWPRDPASTIEVETILKDRTGRRPEVGVGVDAAFLVEDHLVRPGAAGPEPGRYFAYFLKRSRLEDEDEVVARVQRATGLKGVPLTTWFSLDLRRGQRAFSELTTLVANSAFVVSDTYHCCINAMAMRRPVIGIGRREKCQTTTTSDYKKAVLFEMMGTIGSLYLGLPEGATRLSEEDGAALEALARRCADEDLPGDLFDVMDARVGAHRDRLVERLASAG